MGSDQTAPGSGGDNPGPSGDDGNMGVIAGAGAGGCLCLLLVALAVARSRKKKTDKTASAASSSDEILPPGWSMAIDHASGHPCYTNEKTGAMQWEPPPGTQKKKRAKAGKAGAERISNIANPMGQHTQSHARRETILPAGWGKDVDEAGQKYYFSEHDGTT